MLVFNIYFLLENGALHTQAGVWAAAATVSAEASSSNLSSQPLQIDFDNEGDPDVTLVSVSGPDQRDLLMQLTGAFNSMQLVVVAASIVTTEDGRVRDVFKVTDQQQQKVHACISTHAMSLPLDTSKLAHQLHHHQQVSQLCQHKIHRETAVLLPADS